MAWVKVWYDIKHQDQITATAAVDDRGNVTSCTYQYIQTYFAQADGFVTTISALSAVDPTSGLAVPQIGTTVSVGGIAAFKVTRVMPKRSTESSLVFEIQIEYTVKFNVQPGSANKWNINLKFSGQKTTQQAYQDKDGNDIANTAGQPYDPSVSETLYDEVVTISYDTTDPPDLSSLRGKVNSDDISFTISGLERGYTARMLLLEDGDVSATFTLSDFTTIVWKVNLVFVYRADTWVDHILDQGYYQINGSGELIPCLDEHGNPINAPARLDGSGAQITDPTASPHYSAFKIEGEAALSSLFDGLS